VLKLLVTADDIEATIADIRLLTPLRALAARGGFELCERSMFACTQADLDGADVLIAQRPSTRRAFSLMQRMHDRGGCVICEIDDLLTGLAPHLAQAGQAVERADWSRRCLQVADAVSVSTARLGEAVATHAKRWTEIPNYAWPHAVPALRRGPVPGPLTLLIAASDRTASGFLHAPLRRLQAELGDAIRVVCVGPPAREFAAAGVAVQALALMPRAEFLAMAGGLSNPLALIPLDDSPFSACKSAIKFFDYAVIGVPVICSDLTPYRDVIRQGITGGLVANEEAAWEGALRSALDDATTRAAWAAAAHEEANKRFALAKTVDAWQALLSSLPPRRSPPRSGLLQAGWDRVRSALLRANRDRLARRRRRQGR
jgi:hypothetical protein